MKKLALLLAALVAALLCPQASAAVFTIADGDVAALAAAITTANSNGADDTIELAASGTYTLTARDNLINGLPRIGADGGKKLTIHGNGATLQRSTAAGTLKFRILYVGSGANVTITSLTIANGDITLLGGSFGGGIYNDGESGSVTLSIFNSTFINNSADYGGALYNDGEMVGATLSVTNSTFLNNSANYGAGIFNDGAFGRAALSVSNSTFSLNSASIDGGGIQHDAFTGSATGSVSNSTFSRNSAVRNGGGIYTDGEAGNAMLNVTNCTFSQNSAGTNGGGIYNSTGAGGTVALSIGNTILKTGASGENIFNNPGTVISLGYNLSSDAAGGDGTTGPGGLLNATGDQRNTDPLLDPAGLNSNGGPTPTIALLSTSPAIGSGNNNVLSLPLNLTTDQRGFVRQIGANVDVGAFEFGAFQVTLRMDFDADRKPDYLLFKASTGQSGVWYMNGPAFVSGANGPTLPAGWSIVAAADFNGDGKPDYLLFKASTGQTGVWFMNGTTFVSGANGPTLPAGWSIASSEDWNGDGKPDYLLFKASTGQTGIWYMNGPAFVSSANGPTLPAGWSIASGENFNGDGKPDYLLFNAATGQSGIWYMNGPAFVSGANGPTLPAGWSLAAH